MSYTYKHQNSYIAVKNEYGGFRTPDSTLDAALALGHPLDMLRDEEINVPEPKLAREEIPLHGSGSRNRTAFLADHDYEVAEVELPQFVQSAQMDWLALGSCLTVSSTTLLAADVIASGEGTATLTLTTGGCTTDAFIGGYLEFTSGTLSGNKYHVIDNTASTITLDKVVPSGANSGDMKVMGTTFTHTITENQSSQPTIAVHVESENTTDAQSIRRDLLGGVVSKTTVRFEKGSGHRDSTVMFAKSVAGSDLARDTGKDAITLMELKHIDTFTFGYNSGNPILKADVNSIEISIENAIELMHVAGDAYAGTPSYGTRDYEIKINYNPTNKTVHDLLNTAIGSYATDLTLVVRAYVSATQYIQWTFSSLYVSEHGQMLPTKDKGFLSTDLTLRNAAGGTLAISAVDTFGLAYYEGSD